MWKERSKLHPLPKTALWEAALQTVDGLQLPRHVQCWARQTRGERAWLGWRALGQQSVDQLQPLT